MLKKTNELRIKKNGNGSIESNTFLEKAMGVPSLDSNLSRRELIQKAAFASLLTAFPWADRVYAAVPPPPQITFQKNASGDGIIGPFGEARIYNVSGQVLPIIVSAKNGMAVMSFTGRIPFVRFGKAGDATAITVTSHGVQFGSAAPLKWSAAVINDLIKTIVNDPNKASGAMQLRSALYTCYPVADMALIPQYTMGRQMAAVMSQHAMAYGAKSMICTTTTVTEAVTRTITETVNVIMTAEQQYQACYDAQIGRDPCRSAGVFAGACAATICAAKAFLDIVTGTVTVVTTIVEEVTRQVMVCRTPSPNRWPNPWDYTGYIDKYIVPQKKQQFNILDAVNFLKSVISFFGPFAKCLLDGKWSLAELQTPLNLGGQVVLPYGVRVCITAECARQLALQGIGGELTTTWISLLGALAALSPAFAAVAAGFGIVATPAILAAAGAVPEAVVGAAAIILAFIILAMYYATVISAQLTVQVCCTNNLADGLVCIEHPTFAIALVSIAIFLGGPAILIPPIVTG